MRTALAFALLLLPGLASAEIYKWVDAQGKVHFDQRPVAGAKQVEVKPQVIESDEATRQRQERADSFYKARRDEQQQAEQRASQQQAQVTERCGKLRKELGKIAPGVPYYSVDSKGERRYYSDQELDAARRQLSQQIARECQ
ncbi:MAG: DUF4124 domain-containing protein [Pseudomonas sp.]|uniref:DUF4124 domain-containing protein n=1 Tax=Pseudomonas sp. TaxID=306 RepID=UPI0030F17A97